MTKQLSPLKTELVHLQTKLIKEDEDLSTMLNTAHRLRYEAGQLELECRVRQVKQDSRRARISDLERRINFSNRSVSSLKEARLIINQWIRQPNDLQPLWVNTNARFNFLVKQFGINQINLFKSYLEGKVGFKRNKREQIAQWCEKNQDFIFP